MQLQGNDTWQLHFFVPRFQEKVVENDFFAH